MTSSYNSSEYLINVIPDTTNNAALILANILHQQDVYMNTAITDYVFYAYRISYSDNYTLTKLNANGTVYIYYILI